MTRASRDYRRGGNKVSHTSHQFLPQTTNVKKAVYYHETYLLRPEMPTLSDLGRFLGLDEPGDGGQAKYQAEESNRGHPDIDEARSEVITEGTQRAPALFVTT